MITCCLEYDFRNIVVGYEEMIQCLKKGDHLKDNIVKVLCDSEIIVQQIRNMTHRVSTDLKNSQREAWDLINHFEYFIINSFPTS